MQHPKAPVPMAEGDGSDWVYYALAPFIFAFAVLRWMLSTLNLLGPGVVVETGVAPGGGPVETEPGATYFVAGHTERGSTTEAVLIRSMAEYTEKLGARVAYGTLHDDLQTFFAEQGGRAYVSRVVGAGATLGTLTLNDRAGVPQPTVRIDADNVGSWSTQVTIEVANGVAANTFNVIVRLNGDIVETYKDLTDPAAAVATINNSSALITAVNLGSATAAPNNNPAVLAPTALSAGTDDRGTVVAADMVTAANNRFTKDLGPGAVAIPGQASAAVGAGLIAHAKSNRREALLAPAAGSSVSQARTAAQALRGTTGSEAAGLFYPHIRVPDGSGGTRTISPEGYVAACRARALRIGPWRAAAGELAVAKHVVGLERTLTQAEIESLTDDLVNTIKLFGGAPRVYGWRSLSNDAVNYRMLTGAATLNLGAHLAGQKLEKYVFASPDSAGRLFAEATTDLSDIFEPWRNAGGLYERLGPDGHPLDGGYVIDMGPSVNTEATLARNEINAVIGMRVSPVGELIRVRITKVPINASL